MRKFKTRFKLVKSWGFFLIYSSLAVDGGEIKESFGCEQRFLLSLTEKKEQGTSASQGVHEANTGQESARERIANWFFSLTG